MKNFSASFLWKHSYISVNPDDELFIPVELRGGGGVITSSQHTHILYQPWLTIMYKNKEFIFSTIKWQYNAKYSYNNPGSLHVWQCTRYSYTMSYVWITFICSPVWKSKQKQPQHFIMNTSNGPPIKSVMPNWRYVPCCT